MSKHRPSAPSIAQRLDALAHALLVGLPIQRETVVMTLLQIVCEMEELPLEAVRVLTPPLSKPDTH